MSTKAIYQSKDQNWPDGTTVYWFDVDGEQYGVVKGAESWNSKVVDCDSMPSADYPLDIFNITDEMISE